MFEKLYLNFESGSFDLSKIDIYDQKIVSINFRFVLNHWKSLN